MIYGARRKWERVEVEVVVKHRLDGAMLPIEVCWEDGRRWRVELLGDARRTRVEHLGNYALAYPVYIVTQSGKRFKRKLYYDPENHKWFVVRHEFAKGRPIIIDQHGQEHFCTIPQRYGKSYCDPEMRRNCPIDNNCV